MKNILELVVADTVKKDSLLNKQKNKYINEIE